MNDPIKYKITFVDMVTSKPRLSQETGSIRTSKGLERWLSTYVSYLSKYPGTRLIIEPVLNIETGELFNSKYF